MAVEGPHLVSLESGQVEDAAESPAHPPDALEQWAQDRQRLDNPGPRSSGYGHKKWWARLWDIAAPKG